MKKQKNSSAWMALPLYIFTIVFVICPLLYVVALSFATPNRGYGVTWKFTLDNYKNILEPVYLNTFVESLKLALTSTAAIVLIGYPFGYFMAKLPEHRKKKAHLLLTLPFWVNSLIRLYGWIIILQKKGLLNFVLMKLGLIKKPLAILYSYPAIVVGMIYVLLPFMIMSVYSSAEKLDWSYVEAARDLGASRVQAFFTVTLKLTLPGLLSGVILTFVPSMGLFFIAVFTYPEFEAKQVMPAMFGIVYVAVMLSFIYLTQSTSGTENSMVWLIFLCSWGCDTCAYCVGMLIGKHKMAPVLKPEEIRRGSRWRCGGRCTSGC